uniref:Uncharacterized protein n=1 Tax=Avena sativa TaxID=4498 RepID=A0ACD6ACH1_AVESA
MYRAHRSALTAVHPTGYSTTTKLDLHHTHPSMASVKLAASALAVILLVCAAATTATAYRPKPQPQREDCKRQAEYFKNCLRLGYKNQCCGDEHVGAVADSECLCEVEREAEIQCALGRRRCGGIAKKVKVAEMNLPCLANLHCNRA